jgi:hypothetical protein
MEILIIILTVLGVFRLSTWMVYGSLINDKQWYQVLEKQIQDNSELNPFDLDIIRIGKLPFISKIPFDILGYYYIHNIGVIPRWSKSHKLIKAEFEKCKQKYLEKYK